MRTKDQIILEQLYGKIIGENLDDNNPVQSEVTPDEEVKKTETPSTDENQVEQDDTHEGETPVEKQGEAILKRNPDEGLSDEELQKIENLLSQEGAPE